MIFVGDTNQAINGFAGADPASVQRIEAHTQAQRFPLPICYRCPTSHIELARAHVPYMEARPSAPVGTIGHIKENDLAKMVQIGDLVLCRATEPVLRWAFRLMQAGKPVMVRGRELSEDLVGLIHTIERREGFTFTKFGEHLTQYEQEQRERLRQREEHEQLVESLEDRCMAVRVCYEHLGAKSIKDLVTKVNHLFKEEHGRVVLSTIHRAKGSEAKRVFLLESKKLPLTWMGQQDWEYEQEQHIRYVALTRATEALFFVED
jgi:superfamily I DNA/RNA helicase